jgi:hypothetical protein
LMAGNWIFRGRYEKGFRGGGKVIKTDFLALRGN